MEDLTLQIFTNKQWQDIAIISFPNSEEDDYTVTNLEYFDQYTLEHIDKDDVHAVSLNYPVSFYFDDDTPPNWLKFLDDIMPSGASRKYWIKFLDIEDLSIQQQNFILLKYGTISPIIRGNGFIRLAPIYDFAPMKADPEGIPRSTKWKAPLEIGGVYDFSGIANSLSDLVPEAILLNELKKTARQCLGLKARLANRGVPEQILNMPSIGFDFIPENLTRWGLV